MFLAFVLDHSKDHHQIMVPENDYCMAINCLPIDNYTKDVGSVLSARTFISVLP